MSLHFVLYTQSLCSLQTHHRSASQTKPMCFVEKKISDTIKNVVSDKDFKGDFVSGAREFTAQSGCAAAAAAAEPFCPPAATAAA